MPVTKITGASVARQLARLKGAGRMTHIDVRHSWLQSAFEEGKYIVKNLSRKENPADVLTYAPSKAELDVFMPTVG